MQQVMFGMRIVGPPIAGMLYVALGARTCYIGDAISFVCSGLLIASLALDKPFAESLSGSPAPEASTPGKGLASILPDMRVGIDFILHHAEVLFVILALAAGMFVIGCFGPLIAVYTRDSLHASTRSYSFISAMIGVGMFIGVNAINSAGKKIKNTTLVYAGLIGIGLGLCLLTAIPRVWAALLADLIIGFAVAGIVVPATVLIQQETPPALMGRVGSTNMSIIFTAQILGLVLSGIFAEHIGVRHVFGYCAVLIVLLAAAGRFRMHPAPRPAPAA
jgi:MFS family permease